MTCSFADCAREARSLGGLCRAHQLQLSRYGRDGLRPLLIRRAPLAERFWSKVDKSGDCWAWTGSRNPKGYGRLSTPGGVRHAHVVSWELHNGPVPPGKLVMHSCDNPPCVRPDHLKTGTAKDNTADMMAKGRQRFDGLELGRGAH